MHCSSPQHPSHPNSSWFWHVHFRTPQPLNPSARGLVLTVVWVLHPLDHTLDLITDTDDWIFYVTWPSLWSPLPVLLSSFPLVCQQQSFKPTRPTTHWSSHVSLLLMPTVPSAHCSAEMPPSGQAVPAHPEGLCPLLFSVLTRRIPMLYKSSGMSWTCLERIRYLLSVLTLTLWSQTWRGPAGLPGDHIAFSPVWALTPSLHPHAPNTSPPLPSRWANSPDFHCAEKTEVTGEEPLPHEFLATSVWPQFLPSATPGGSRPPPPAPPLTSCSLTPRGSSSHSFLSHTVNFALSSGSFPLANRLLLFLSLKKNPLLSPHALLATAPHLAFLL